MMLLLPIALAACAGSDDGSSISYTSDRNGTNQPLPTNCRLQLLAFMRTTSTFPLACMMVRAKTA